VNIILNFDPSVANAPPGFKDAIYQAAAIYDALFTSSLTVTIDVGYDEIDGRPLPGGDVSSSLTDYNNVKYAALAAALPGADAVPGSDPTNGTGTYEIAAPLQALLGLGGSNPVEYIGVAAVPLDVTPGTVPAAGQYDLEGLALHEISEVLGRYALGGMGGNYSALDLLRYVAPGTLALGSQAAAGLSVNGGAALLGTFNNAGNGVDPGDWAGYNGDAYGAAVPGGTLQLSQIDLAEMAALGYAETANAIGGGMDFLNDAGPDTFYAGADGAILVMEQAPGGMFPAMVLQDGSALAAPGTDVIGTGRNLLGTNGNDVFFRTATADLYVYEFGIAGIATAAVWLRNLDGSIMNAAAGTGVIGGASNLYGTGGTDLVFQTLAGSLYVYEYNALGVATAATSLTNPDGSVETAAAGTSVIGSGDNLLGCSGTALFFRAATGGLYVYEYNLLGTAMSAGWLTNPNGSIETSADGTSVIGTANNLYGTGGTDAVFRLAAGGLYVYEYNAGGVSTAATALVNSDASVETAAAGTSVIGTGSNLYGTGGTDLVFRTLAGSLYVYEYNAIGVSTAATALVNPDGSVETAAPGTNVIGTASDLYGTGGTDVVFQTMAGSLYVYEYNAVGVSTAATALVNPDGSAETAAPGTSVIGGGTDLFGLGGHDLVFRTEAGQLYAYEYNPVGVAIAAAWLRNPDGSVITVAPGTTELGTASNLLGDGGHDLLLRTSADTAYAFEFNPMAELIGATWLTYGPGAPETFALGSQVTMTGSNLFGLGGTDFLVRQPGMAAYFIESNHAGAVVGARLA